MGLSTAYRSRSATAIVVAIVMLASTFITVAAAPPADAAIISGFEIDGDEVSNEGGIDWDSAVIAPNFDTRTDPCQANGDAASDDTGNGGAKFDDQPPEIQIKPAPEFADLCLTQSTYFFDGTDVIFCMAWRRTKAQGSNSYFFEINQSDDQFGNGLPVRSNGDVLIEFVDDANDTQILYRVYADGVPSESIEDTTFTLAAMSDDQLFGEACINLTQTIFSPDQCINFGQMWMFSLASNSLNSALFEIVLPRTDIGVTNCGTVLVEKQTQPAGSPATFDFQLSSQSPSNLETDPSVSTPLADGGAFGTWDTTLDSLATADPNRVLLLPGTYLLEELPLPDGWALDSVTCEEIYDPTTNLQQILPIDSTIDQASGAVTVNLDLNETVTCTYTNVQTAIIEIAKVTEPAGSTQLFEFSVTDSGLSELGPLIAADGEVQALQVVAGDVYSIAEQPTDGWELAGATCDNGDDVTAISPAAGDVIRCTFTNEEIVVVVVPDPPALTIEKTAVLGPQGSCPGVDGTPLTVDEGAVVTYCITVTNSGLGDATNVVVDDNLQGPLTLSSTTIAANGGTASATYDVTTTGTDPITNIATVNADDPNNPGNPLYPPGEEPTDEAIVEPVPPPPVLAPAIQLDKTVTGTTCDNSFDALVVDFGSTVRWCFTVTNTGANTLLVTEVSDADLGLTIPIPADDQLMAPGASVSVSTVGTATGALTNVATVEGFVTEVDGTPILDFPPVTDTDEASIDSRSADLSITKTAEDDEPVNAGDPVTFTVEVNNAGPDAATNVVVTDTLPAGMTFLEAVTVPADWTCDAARGDTEFSCTTAFLGNGASASITYRVILELEAQPGVPLVNTAVVESDLIDPDPTNNEDTESTERLPPPPGVRLETPEPPEQPDPPAPPPPDEVLGLAVTASESLTGATVAMALLYFGAVMSLATRRREDEV